MHTGTFVTSSAGRKFVNKLSITFESAKAEQTMIEVAGIGKIAVEEREMILNCKSNER